MSVELSIPTILSIGKICQYSQSVMIGKNSAFKGGNIDQRLARLIYMERIGIQRAYDLNPNDPTLRSTANYLFSILKGQSVAQKIINDLAQSKPAITGPSNQTVNVGQNAMFTVSITSTLPILSIQWYDYLGNAISGATGTIYTFSNAQLSDSGKTFFVKASNAAGETISGTGTLTVSAAYVADYWFGTTDYSSDLKSGIDSVPFLGTFPITAGQPLSFTWPSGAALNQYIVVRYPVAETTKTQYANAPLNNGIIPSIAYDNVVTIGSYKYIFSRSGNPFSMNTAAPLIFS